MILIFPSINGRIRNSTKPIMLRLLSSAKSFSIIRCSQQYSYIRHFYYITSKIQFSTSSNKKEPPESSSSRKSCQLLYRMSHDIKGVLSGHSECKLHRPSPKLDDAAYNLIFGKTGIVFRSAMRSPTKNERPL